MNMKSVLRHAPVFAAALCILGTAFPSSALAAKFPPLNSPATTEHLSGKLVWADLITTNPEAAAKFYCELLGWTAAPLEQKGKGYTVFSNNNVPVAGLAPRTASSGSHPARWIGYYAVADIDAVLALATKNGATMRAPSRNFPDRGRQAIFTDKDGIPIGILQSSSGDTADADPAPGGWNWFELYVKNPESTGDFYHAVIGFDATAETNSDRKSDLVLSSEGRARGGVAPLSGEDPKPSWLGVIRVADLDATLAKVPGLGGEVLLAPHAVEYGSRFAIILDSTGGTVGLVQYADDANPAKSK